MKFIPVICLSIMLLFSFCKHQKETSSAKGHSRIFSGWVMIQNDYCGGAEPEHDSILHPAPRPAAHTKIYFRTGDVNSGRIIDSVESGDDGSFRIELKSGRYCVIEGKKNGVYNAPKDDQWTTYDTACYHAEYLKCDHELDLTKGNVSDAQIILKHHCPWTRPCVNYRGPLPPAAQKPHNE